MKRTPDGKFTSEENFGRPKGSTSKQTKAIRERFKMLLNNNLDALQSDLDQLKPADRINAILSLARYVVPTLKATEMSFEDVSQHSNFKPIKIVIDKTEENGSN